MKTKKLPRYFCEFCNKSGGSKHYMGVHEAHCTRNPDRKCRICRFAAFNVNRNFRDMIAQTKAQIEEMRNSSVDEYRSRMNEILVWLKASCGNCPACTLAVIRQANAVMDGFDYQQEISAWWRENSRRQHDYDS